MFSIWLNVTSHYPCHVFSKLAGLEEMKTHITAQIQHLYTDSTCAGHEWQHQWNTHHNNNNIPNGCDRAREKPRVKPFQYHSTTCIDDVHRAAIVYRGRIELKSDVVAMCVCVCVFQSELHSFLQYINIISSSYECCTVILQRYLSLSGAFCVSVCVFMCAFITRSCVVALRGCICEQEQSHRNFLMDFTTRISALRTHHHMHALERENQWQSTPLATTTTTLRINIAHIEAICRLYIAMCKCERSKVALQQVT